MALAVPALDKERRGVADAALGIDKRQAELDSQVSVESAAREKEMAPLEKGIQEAAAAPLPEKRKVDLPQEPKQKNEDFTAFGYGLIAMAMLGGAASRGNWMNVTASLNGAMKGKIEGNQAAQQQEYAKYEREFKKAVADERQANQEMQDALDKRNTPIREKIDLYRIAAAKHDRQAELFAARQKNLDTMRSHLDQRRSALTKLEEQHERLAPGLNTGGLSERYTSDPQYKKNVDFWAGIIQKGGSLPPRFAQSGAGKQMMPDIINVVPTLGGGNPNDILANKLSQREMTAEAQKLGTQAASVAIANKELARFIPAAEKAIDAVPRAGFMPINQLIQFGENKWSPQQKQFVIANRAVQTAYAQLIQRGAPTVHSSEEAEKMLNTADSHAVYKAAMKQLMVEGEQAELGLKDAREDLLNRAKSMGSESSPAQGNSHSLTNAKGWKLHEDASGNKAYVGPGGEIEEVK